MTEQHISEEELFEITSGSVAAEASDGTTERLRQLHLRSKSDPSLKVKDTNRRRSSLKKPLPLMTSSGKAVDTAKDAPVGTSAGEESVIGIMSDSGRVKHVPGEPPMVANVTRSNGDVQRVDFWLEVAKIDVTSMEALLMRGHLDPAYDMTQFIHGIEYQGFDRVFYINHALSKMPLMRFSQFALVGAIRGSNFKKITETCEDFPEPLINTFASLSFVKKPKKRRDLTILRCTASIPQWCAYWMKAANVDKKIGDEECPACIQFPGAASLPMSKEVRLKHLKFSIRFSQLLPGGSFNLNIYLTAFQNSIEVKYIPPSIKEVLGVVNEAQANMITAEEITENSKALVIAKK